MEHGRRFLQETFLAGIEANLDIICSTDSYWTPYSKNNPIFNELFSNTPFSSPVHALHDSGGKCACYHIISCYSGIGKVIDQAL